MILCKCLNLLISTVNVLQCICDLTVTDKTFILFQFSQDQMNFVSCQQQKPQMLPSLWPVQGTGIGTSGYLHGPQVSFADEAHIAQQARQNIQARLKMAKLFQQYR